MIFEIRLVPIEPDLTVGGDTVETDPEIEVQSLVSEVEVNGVGLYIVYAAKESAVGHGASEGGNVLRGQEAMHRGVPVQLESKGGTDGGQQERARCDCYEER